MKEAQDKAGTTLDVSELRVHIQKKFNNTQIANRTYTVCHSLCFSLLSTNYCSCHGLSTSSLLSFTCIVLCMLLCHDGVGGEQVCVSNLRVRKMTVALVTWLRQWHHSDDSSKSGQQFLTEVI